eukprot:gb/GFBE01022629.1/.p1 GENE.gb/GFBE01022629.1/~~gb/GFBE01022629.1/.p1  ORF type:complete len:470 (+),score=65.29 gb/GFBE01022629.1/:1-1410(+)
MPRRTLSAAWAWCPRAMTSYETKKVVRIRSGWLQVPHLVVVGCLCCFVLYKSVFLLEILTLDAHLAKVNMKLTQPQRNWNKCHDTVIDCDDADPEYPWPQISLCKEEQLENLNAKARQYFFSDNTSQARNGRLDTLDVTCDVFDASDVVQYVGDDGIFITTSMQTITQEKCADSSCKWKNLGMKTVLVANVEEFRLTARHAWESTLFGTHVKSEETAGLFEPSNGKKRLIPCADAYRDNEYCKHIEDTFPGYEHCSESSNARTSTCFTTGNADFIGVRELLEASDLRLDDTSWGELPLRFWGSGVLMHIELSDGDPWEFWSRWPFQLIPRYTYYFQHGGGQFPLTEALHDTERTRTLKVRRGLRISVNSLGSLRRFDARDAIIKLVAAMFIITYSTRFVDLALVKIYQYVPAMRHIYVMHKSFTIEEHPDEEMVEKAVSRGDSFVEMRRMQEEIDAQRHEMLIEADSDE